MKCISCGVELENVYEPGLISDPYCIKCSSINDFKDVERSESDQGGCHDET